MGMNDTPSSMRVHIGFFGCRNAGKSSVVNAVTGQVLSVVSDVMGTTTDPVYQSMELLPMGPVVIIDTPGFDDEGILGDMRVKKTKQVLNRADCAVLVVDGTVGKTAVDEELIGLFQEKQLPFLVVYNKYDLLCSRGMDKQKEGPGIGTVYAEGLEISALTGFHIHQLKERIAKLVKTDGEDRKLVGDLLRPHDVVVLVIPIDESAPKGRLILPQQQTIRDVLEAGAVSVVVRDTELEETLRSLWKKPAMVITDSQAFQKVSAVTPEDIYLTSFSILMARYKGFLEEAVKGAAVLSSLEEGDKVLISEGCTHHRQCNDIGTVKIPKQLRAYTGKNLIIETSSGQDFPEDLSHYRVIIHCGGCMLNEREVQYREKCAADAGIPFTNYGIALASMQGILKRSLRVFPQLEKLLE